MPLVSIFVCTYNQEKYIAQTLESFLMQECNFDIEIVIGEDCSKDNTLKICIEYQKRFPDKIKLLNRKKNLGLIENFFEGLTHCTGKYIATCGGDDYWTDPLKLQKQVDFLENNPDYIIAYHDSIMIDQNEKLIAESEVGNDNQRDFTAEELQKSVFISARTICFRNVLELSKSDYKKVFNEDYFLFAILGEYGNGKFMPEIKPAVYRILNQGVWSSLSEIQRQIAKISTLKSLEKYYKKQRKMDLCKVYKAKRFETINRVFYMAKTERNTKVFFTYATKCFFASNNVYNTNSKINIIKASLEYILKYFYGK